VSHQGGRQVVELLGAHGGAGAVELGGGAVRLGEGEVDADRTGGSRWTALDAGELELSHERVVGQRGEHGDGRQPGGDRGPGDVDPLAARL
jgi:hypothetical protein